MSKKCYNVTLEVIVEANSRNEVNGLIASAIAAFDKVSPAVVQELRFISSEETDLEDNY